MSYGLDGVISAFYAKRIRGKELIELWRHAEPRKISKYDYLVSASASSTSLVGGDASSIDYEEIDLWEVLIEKPKNTIIIPVTGDSMVGIGIYPGDGLIVEQINLPYQNSEEEDIVVVAVDDETLVKQFRREQGEIVLVSENENHAPIRRSEGSIYITGIVKTAIRRNL